MDDQVKAPLPYAVPPFRLPWNWVGTTAVALALLAFPVGAATSATLEDYLSFVSRDRAEKVGFLFFAGASAAALLLGAIGSADMLRDRRRAKAQWLSVAGMISGGVATIVSIIVERRSFHWF